jgi:hypothetical protein
MVRERDASVFRPQPPENLPVKRSNQPRVIIRNPAKQPVGQQQNEREEKREQRKDPGKSREGK